MAAPTPPALVIGRALGLVLAAMLRATVLRLRVAGASNFWRSLIRTFRDASAKACLGFLRGDRVTHSAWQRVTHSAWQALC